MVWRLVIERVSTLQEVLGFYDLNDVLDAHEALDLRDEAERRAMESSRKGR